MLTHTNPETSSKSVPTANKADATLEDLELRSREIIVYKPEDQLELTDKELNEEQTRVLTASNPNAPDNIVQYSYKERRFKITVNIDQTNVHFEKIGNLLHVDSDAAKTFLSEQSRRLQLKKSQASKNLIDEYIDSEGKKQQRLLINKFNFIERSLQTYNEPARDCESQTEAPSRETFSATANQWVIHDAYSRDHEEKQMELARKSAQRLERLQSARRLKQPNVAAVREIKQEDYSQRLLSSVKLIERMINQNAHDDILQDFKYYEDIADEFREKAGSLLPLWKFSSIATRRMCVCAICWHSTYSDLFAVGIGSYDFFKATDGVIIFYTLKNPSFYEYKIETRSGCMSLDFHPVYPYLLAAGFYDGSVCVYDLRDRKSGESKFKCSIDTDRHHDPVWQIKWQKDDLDGNKNFVSISSDGRIMNWTIRNLKLFAKDLAVLNKVAAGHDDNLIAGLIGCGTCFDFNTKPDNLFVVGTEEGKVFEYSATYFGNLLTAFDAHSMPIYAIKWNPFHERIFITCSADWKVKIWDHHYKDPIMTFDLGSPVSDVAWAPHSSTMFAAVTADGNICIYDISVNRYEATCVQNILQKKKKRKLTHVAFNHVHPVLLVSDDRGSVVTLKLSPNLQKIPRDEHNNIVSVLNKQVYGRTRIEAILAHEREPDQPLAETTRRAYKEKVIKGAKQETENNKKDSKQQEN